MLIDVYPRHVIEFLATHGTGAVPEAVAQLAHSHTGISIFFMDVVGFTPMSKDADPQDVMKMLNELFTALDALCGAHDVYKVNNGRRFAVISGTHACSTFHLFHVKAALHIVPHIALGIGGDGG